MMLYRPFLHYVSSRPPAAGSKPVDERSYACAAACVSVSRNIVHITAEMQRRGFLIGAYWFTMYTTFFAILSLAFFVLENPGKPGAEEIMENASVGRDTLKALARRSLAADRCSQSLTVLFEQLRLRLNLNPPAQTKSNKRSQPSHHLPTPSTSSAKTAKSAATTTSSTPDLAAPQRARTFPTPPSNFPLNPHRRFAPSTSDPNLRASFDMRASTPSGGTSAGGGSTPDTPASMASMGMGGLGLGAGQQQQGQQFYAGLGTGMGGGEELPDLSAVMFPSSDPFAYPAQPMLNTYGAAGGKGDEEGGINDNTAGGGGVPATTGYLDESMTGGQGLFSDPSAGMYGDLEGQIFGPLPGFLMEGGMGGMGMGMGMNGFGGDGMGGTAGEGVVQQVGMVGLGMGGGGGMQGLGNMGMGGYEEYGGEEWGGGGGGNGGGNGGYGG
jgi:hypothetical protein